MTTILLIKMRNIQRIPVKTAKVLIQGGPYEQMRGTIRLIGQAIRNGQTYLPLRNLAAALASTAAPKDYLGQAEAVYNYAIRKWRYVKDPARKELLTFDPHALYQLVLAGDGVGVGLGKGAGDCDCITAALGALLESIGHRTRICTTAPPNSPPGKMFAHVFIQTLIPKRGWVTVDPVLHPHRKFGAVPPNSRIAFYNLDGQLLGSHGNAVGLSGTDGNLEGEEQMYQWQDMGFAGSDDGLEPEDLRNYGLPDFGIYSEQLGIIDTENSGLLAEVQPQLLETPNGKLTLGVRTPMLEIKPRDMKYVRKFGRPYQGMGAVDETGTTYEFDGSLGFFKKLFSAGKSLVKKVSGGIGKIIKKIPGGKYLMKLGNKIWKVAQKFVRPLISWVGKYAYKLAPIVALIPGYGTAIAAGLMAAGKVARLMKKYGVVLKGKGKKVRNGSRQL